MGLDLDFYQCLSELCIFSASECARCLQHVSAYSRTVSLHRIVRISALKPVGMKRGGGAKHSLALISIHAQLAFCKGGTALMDLILSALLM